MPACPQPDLNSLALGKRPFQTDLSPAGPEWQPFWAKYKLKAGQQPTQATALHFPPERPPFYPGSSQLNIPCSPLQGILPRSHFVFLYLRLNLLHGFRIGEVALERERSVNELGLAAPNAEAKGLFQESASRGGSLCLALRLSMCYGTPTSFGRQLSSHYQLAL